MADRGIIFSAPMVRALLDGRKTQTRRLLNPQPSDTRAAGKKVIEVADYCTGAPEQGQAYYWRESGCWNSSEPVKLPHAVGDKLYVRENFQLLSYCDYEVTKEQPADVRFQATDRLANAERDVRGYPWRPCIHMPRWASRLYLTVTDVRVQRLQDISEEDAIAEGTQRKAAEPYRLAFRELWNSLHDKPGTRWEDNPWLYALTFTVHHGNIDGAGNG